MIIQQSNCPLRMIFGTTVEDDCSYALDEDDAIVLHALSADESIGVALVDDRLGGICKLLSDALLGFADLAHLTAGNNDSDLVDNACGSANDVLHLVNDCLEYAIGHIKLPYVWIR